MSRFVHLTAWGALPLRGNRLLRIAFFAVLVLAAFGQSSSVGTSASFPAMLEGGSKGVPHLSGTVSVSQTRIEFEAFPQVENFTLPCARIKTVSFARGNKTVIKIVSTDATYRFDLQAGPQSQRFMAALTSNCKNLAKGSPVAQR
jgi:hypothetical protein